MKQKQLIRHVTICAQLAAVLEVSGSPKPGNVHRTKDHSDARYEHFLVGSIVLGSHICIAASRGLMRAKRKIESSEIGIGKLIKNAVTDISETHFGGNTHLGICILFIPLAAAAAETYFENGDISTNDLRSNIKEIMESTTPSDASKVYEAIRLVSSPNEMGRITDAHAPDIYDKQSERKLLDRRVSLFDIMTKSASYDSIASELVTGMETTFEIGYKELMKSFHISHDINVATVHTFLRILSSVPDTFIARKIGVKYTDDIQKAVDIGRRETVWVSKTAEQILTLGGLMTKEGEASLREFDVRLQTLGKDYSPGTTADLTAASLMIALLCGLKF